MRRARFALACAIVGVCFACDPSLTLLRADALPFLREPLIAACCDCLAETNIVVTGPDQGCTDIPVDAGADPVSPCLCDADRERCDEALHNGLPLVVVGACVENVGPCGDACQGVLAYP